MICCLIGTISNIENKKVTISDRLSGLDYECETEGDLFLNFKVGDQGIFIGPMWNNVIRVKKYELRKLLDPLYEEDLFNINQSMVPLINDPFGDLFLEFLKKNPEA